MCLAQENTVSSEMLARTLVCELKPSQIIRKYNICEIKVSKNFGIYSSLVAVYLGLGNLHPKYIIHDSTIEPQSLC